MTRRMHEHASKSPRSEFGGDGGGLRGYEDLGFETLPAAPFLYVLRGGRVTQHGWSGDPAASNTAPSDPAVRRAAPGQPGSGAD
jgi:hypothetical protein